MQHRTRRPVGPRCRTARRGLCPQQAGVRPPIQGSASSSDSAACSRARTSPNPRFRRPSFPKRFARRSVALRERDRWRSSSGRSKRGTELTQKTYGARPAVFDDGPLSLWFWGVTARVPPEDAKDAAGFMVGSFGTGADCSCRGRGRRNGHSLAVGGGSTGTARSTSPAAVPRTYICMCLRGGARRTRTSRRLQSYTSALAVRSTSRTFPFPA